MVTLTERVDRFELVLRRMQRELEALRREARTASAAESEAPAVPVVAAVVAEPEPEPVPTPVVLPPAPEEPHRPRFDLGALLGRFDLLGAGGLAVAGGAVTALGIMLLFVLAAERGWIGPVERVAAGALISTLVFGAGVVLHRRYGQIAAGLAAVGAGLALFGLTLAKIFLFDLAELSSVARAASFVAVGGLLLAGGVLVQRLSEPEVDILER